MAMENKQQKAIELLPSDDDIEALALQAEARYNECHFWKRGKIYADGLRVGARWIRDKTNLNDQQKII